jgi:putative DNA methylase
VATYLALALDMMAAFCNTLARWENTSEAIKQLFSRQALPMLWDYAELHPFSGSTGSWEAGWEYYLGVLAHLTRIPPANPQPASPTIAHGTATALPWPDNFFDAVLTDPPYYDNVPYGDTIRLSSTSGSSGWLATSTQTFSPRRSRQSQRRWWPMPAKRAGWKTARFEEMLTQSFREIHRVLKPDGIAVIVFAHKTTEAWETVINALLEAGLYMTASWPIHTEMQARLRAQESAALASSIYMVCRKRTTSEVGEYPTVRKEIEARVRQKLTQFWAEGIRGADFFMSAIGPAVEAFGKYARVEKLSGEPVTVEELLEYVRQVVSQFALERILKRTPLGSVDAPTRFYALWRWTYNSARVHFDEARKLGQAVGVEVTALWDQTGFVKREKEFVRVLGPKDRGADFLQRERNDTMVDVLHKAVLLWEQGEERGLEELLRTAPFPQEALRQVAQDLSEILPQGDKEKQLLQGLLYGWEARTRHSERGLFEGEEGR